MGQVYFDDNCKSKFDGEKIFLQNTRPDTLILPCILFSHQTGLQEINSHLCDFKQDLRDAKIAICYLSDAPNCGLTDDEAQLLSEKYNNFVHILRQTMPNLSKDEKPNAYFIKRLRLLLEEPRLVSETLPPKWQLLYPPSYPESLVAANLLLVAEQAGLVINDLDHTSLWAEAGKQFCDEARNRSLKTAIREVIPVEGWCHPIREDVDKCQNAIRSLFEIIDGAQ